MNDRIESLLRFWKPPPKMTVEEWAEQNRVLSRGVSSQPGRWRSLPYQKEPMQSVTDGDNPCTVLCTATQLFKTEVINNAIGYFVDKEPCNILLKYPTLTKAKNVSRRKITPLFRDTPCLSTKLYEGNRRDSKNTQESKDFMGGSLFLVGGNSAASLRGDSCRVVIQDEIDSDTANSEGDPVTLADKRCESFNDAVKIKASSPTLKGQSRIWEELERSDWREWFCPCPKCGEHQTLKWEQVKWTWKNEDGSETKDITRACYVCQTCNAELTDLERIQMVLAGHWRKTRPENKAHGYRLNGLARVLGDKKGFTSYLHKWADEYLKSKRNPDSFRVWKNTFMCELWIEEVVELEHTGLMRRAEAYDARHILPDGVLVLTGFCDVQHNRLELLVDGWGLDEECWHLEHVLLMGPTNQRPVWEKLTAELSRKWKHPRLGELGVELSFIDSGDGDRQKDVFRFVNTAQKVNVAASRGHEAGGLMVIPRMPTRRDPPGTPVVMAMQVSMLKRDLFRSLNVTKPGPRHHHFGPPMRGFTEEWFRQLTAEKCVMEPLRGYLKPVWHKTRERNEALDCAVGTLAVVRYLNPNFDALTPPPEGQEQPAAEAPPLIRDEAANWY